MSFVSITHNESHYANGYMINEYIIMDSDFGEVKGNAYCGTRIFISRTICVAQEYASRNLPVGKNIALYVLYQLRSITRPVSHDTIRRLTDEQDKYCPESIGNWRFLAKKRDEYLQKYLSLL